MLAGALFITPLEASYESQQKSEWDAAVEAVQQQMVHGPSAISLLQQAVLNLPEGTIYVPQPAADLYMHALGNSKSPSRIGLVLAATEGQDWFVDISHTTSGYIADDDARDWDADDLMDTLQEGTEHGNKERKSRGFPKLILTGWVEKPAYDPQTHQLVWSIGARSEDDPKDQPETINYNTFLLGRDGYFELDLVTSSDVIEQQKSVAWNLLDNIQYNEGKRYADFNPNTDHMAEYGLAALVTGVAAKKLGLLAVIGAFLMKFAKVIMIGFFVFWGGIKAFFTGSKNAGK